MSGFDIRPMNPPSASPTRQEIQEEIQRILASQLFLAAPKQAKFLSFILRKSLDGQEISEDILGYEMFEGYKKDESTDVRVAASNVRKRLQQYYDNEGRGDIVRIDLPVPTREGKTKLAPGLAYEPIFKYNPLARSMQLFDQGMEHLNKGRGPWHLRDAYFCFANVLKEQPGYALALAAQADALLRGWFRNQLLEVATEEELPATGDTEEMQFTTGGPASCWNIPHLHAMALKATELDSKCWYGHLMLGTAQACMWQWAEAEKSFEQSLLLNAEETRNHSWYPAFLLAIGKQDEAMSIVRTRASRYPDDTRAQIALGLFLYATGEIVEADQAITAAHLRDPSTWQIPLLDAYNMLAMRYDEDRFRYIENRLEVVAAHEECRHETRDAFPGLMTVLDVVERGINITPEKLDAIIKQPGIKAEQLFFAYSIVNEQEKATEILAQECRNHSPLMVWLHLWPILALPPEWANLSDLLKSMRLPYDPAPASMGPAEWTDPDNPPLALYMMHKAPLRNPR